MKIIGLPGMLASSSRRVSLFHSPVFRLVFRGRQVAPIVSTEEIVAGLLCERVKFWGGRRVYRCTWTGGKGVDRTVDGIATQVLLTRSMLVSLLYQNTAARKETSLTRRVACRGRESSTPRRVSFYRTREEIFPTRRNLQEVQLTGNEARLFYFVVLDSLADR